MKNLTFVLIALLFVVSCKKDACPDSKNQSGNDSQKYAKLADHAMAVCDFKANAQPTVYSKNQVTKSLSMTGTGAISYNPNVCGSGTVQVYAPGSGNSSHFGIFTQLTSFCVDGATGFPLGPIGGTIVAANKDEVYYMFSGMGVDATTGLVYQDYALTGGSGRFTGASGNLHLLYSVRTATYYAYTGSGSITY